MLETVLGIIQLSTYLVSLVLAGYVLSRGQFQPLSLVTSGILGCYALIQADQFLGAYFEGQLGIIRRVLWVVYPLPVVLWVRMGLILRPSGPLDLTFDRVWWSLLLPVTMVLVFGGAIGEEMIDFARGEHGPLYWVYPLYNLVMMIIGLVLHYHNYQQLAPTDAMRKVFGVMVLASIGYLGSMLLLWMGFFSPSAIFALLALDYILLGMAGIVYDAFSEGQLIQHDIGMTFIKVLLIVAIVVAPWGVASMLAEAFTLAMAVALFLSLGVIALGVGLQDQIETLLEQVILRRRNPQREALRTLLLNSARIPDLAITSHEDDPEAFIRLTRRALSHLPNLPRLAASPLTNLRLVSARMESDANTLQRAQELRQVLRECIDTLRPQAEQAYGTGDEWRFYNALYYPYVAGISPYKRYPYSEPMTDELKMMLRWFQQEVPPRTLYNWQNRGAEMIAGILLEREKGA